MEQDINRDSTPEKNSVVRLEETERYEEMVRFQQDGDDGGGAGRKCLIINQTKVTTSVPFFFKNLFRVLGKVVLLQNLTHNPIMNHWMTKYTVIIEKNPVTGCYVGQCKQIPEAFSQGRTVEELMANMKEAVSLAIDCREED